MRTKSAIHIIFPIIFLFLTILTVSSGWWIWRDVKNDKAIELTNSVNLLSRFYSITFNQRELSLISLGQRLTEIDGPNQAEMRLQVIEEALAIYEDLSAIGFVDTTGQVVALTGYSVDGHLPNLSKMSETFRSFQQVKNSEGLVIGEVYYFDKVNDWILPLRVAIRNEEGNVIAYNTTAMFYTRMTENIKSFGFPPEYRIQFINTSHQTTQFYYPLKRSEYTEVLRQPFNIYQKVDSISSVGRFTLFTAIQSRFEELELVASTMLPNLNHQVIVSIPYEIINEEFWSTFRLVVLAYLLFMLITGLSYFYFVKTEVRYINELQNERDHSNHIIQSSPALIIGIDPDFKTTFVNPTTERILGSPISNDDNSYFLHHMLGLSSEEALPEKIQNLQETPLDNDIIKVYDEHGRPKTIIWSSVNIFDANHKVEEVFLFGSDQSEKEAALVKLKSREANLQSIIKSTQSLIALFDTGLKLIEYNQSFENFVLATQDIHSIEEFDLSGSLTTANSFIDLRMVEKVLKGQKLTDTYTFQSGNGTLFLLINYNPITQDHEITGFSIFIEDITALKETQQQLQKYSDDLEGLVYSRTQELEEANALLKTSNKELNETLEKLKLTQKQLVQNEKMASLGILSAGIGHEINNPLNFIKNGVYALDLELKNSKTDNSDRIDSFLKIINEGVERASTIVKSLSNFSRIGGDLMEKCDVTQIIDNSLVILQNQLKHKVEIIKKYNHEDAIILGNAGKLHQAFLNLLSNAEQSIEEFGKISISTQLAKNQIIVNIEDTGSGIHPNILDKISDPFFTTKEPGKGTGLGLSITYSIIREHKGHIDVTSKSGKGTKFTLTLPISNNET